MSQVRKFHFCTAKKYIGSGSFGTVWAAKDNCSGKKIAVKVIRRPFRSAKHSQMVYREVKILAALRAHPNIIQLLRVNKSKMELFLSLELMQSDLAEALYCRPIATNRALTHISYQIINGIYFLHASRIMHRDLKPNNILVDRHFQCKITDFGCARFFQKFNEAFSNEEERPGVVGALRYRAPETLLIDCSYTQARDIWSVGAIIAEILLRKQLFLASNVKTLIQVILGTIPNRGTQGMGLQGQLEAVVDGPVPRLNKTLDEMLAPSEYSDFVKSLLVIEPKLRPTARQALDDDIFEIYREIIPIIKADVRLVPGIPDRTLSCSRTYRRHIAAIMRAHNGRSNTVATNSSTRILRSATSRNLRLLNS